MILFKTLLMSALMAEGAAMTADDRAMRMEVDEAPDGVEIRLIADSAVDRQASYEMEVIGTSRSVHRGRSRLPANTPVTVSRISVSHDGTWCALVHVSEENGATYELEAGDCSVLKGGQN